MKHISSRDNPLYKRVLRLAGGKRDPGADADAPRVVLEGAHLCQAWLRYAGAPELALFDVEKLEPQAELKEDRKSVVKGKSVSVRVDLGGRRSIKKKKRVN